MQFSGVDRRDRRYYFGKASKIPRMTRIMDKTEWTTLVTTMFNTADGRNPAPVNMGDIPVFTRFYTSQVVQNFSHQQYVHNFASLRFSIMFFQTARKLYLLRCKDQECTQVGNFPFWTNFFWGGWWTWGHSLQVHKLENTHRIHWEWYI